MDCLTPEQRHKNMVNIKSKNTSIEVILRKALWKRGIRYRKNCRGHQILFLLNTKLRYFVIVNFFMEKIGKC